MSPATSDASHIWERFHQQGLGHTRRNELEEALLAHRSALTTCDSDPDLPRAIHNRHVSLAEIGYVYRMLGRFLKACECLEQATQGMQRDESCLKALGELAIVYRHLDMLDEAKQACEEQYRSAKQMGFEQEVERAIGNLGMVNYQLFLLNHDPKLLALAIEQLEERVNICQRLRKPTESQGDSHVGAAKIQTATAREAIAFARLSLCYTAQGDIVKAINAASECQGLSVQSGDPSKIAFSRVFYGRALLLNGQREEALAQFNPPDGNTPISALSKEPCEEYRGYIREMIDAGADLTVRDRSGYSALDYAVYNGDELTKNILVQALQMQLSHEEVEQHQWESTLRKGYRELFQDILRPVLLDADKATSTKRLRQAYARALAADEEKARQFDTFKYVRFTDFARHGRLPRSTDNLTRRIVSDVDESVLVVFISYTWHKNQGGDNLTPDDSQNTKYHQMVSAIGTFLQAHPDVDPKTVCIWLDWACIDQVDAEMQARGVAALPMSIAQCSAMVSIVDETYFERAWCCVEVITIRALQRSYNAHWWHEYVYDAGRGTRILRDGRVDETLSATSARVSVESDRPKINFLERQAKLLEYAVGI